MFRSIWAYRGFIRESVKREFQIKYLNSLLGAAWSVINPLAMILIYTVIFVQVMRAKLPGVDSTFAYSIYLCAGVLTWGLFAEITGRAQNTFLENANLLKKLSFPRLCLPVVVVANAALNSAIIFVCSPCSCSRHATSQGWLIWQWCPCWLFCQPLLLALA
jgi:lipopolysaccharide transport system permease protein